MPALYDPARHEPLADLAWDAGVARRTIDEIVTASVEAYTPEILWPIHPDDGPPEWISLTGLYFGAVGVAWTLDWLAREGAAAPIPRIVDQLGAMEQRNAAMAAMLGGPVGGLLLGGGGPAMALWRATSDASALAKLAELIDGNAGAAANELMWGEPGTMLLALALHEATGEARWAEAFRAGERRLWERLAPVEAAGGARLWTQDVYGQTNCWLGLAHGFAGNALVVAKGFPLLPPDRHAEWAEVIETGLRTTALRDGPLTNWPDEAPSAAGATPHLQICHGAPGVALALAALPGADDLLMSAAETIWRAGPLRKGPGLCHGTAGNAYAFLELFARTGEETWLVRARAFAMHAIAQSRARAAEVGRRRFSLWTGDLGLACFLWECLGARARFPTLDVW